MERVHSKVDSLCDALSEDVRNHGTETCSRHEYICVGMSGNILVS